MAEDEGPGLFWGVLSERDDPCGIPIQRRRKFDIFPIGFVHGHPGGVLVASGILQGAVELYPGVRVMEPLDWTLPRYGCVNQGRVGQLCSPEEVVGDDFSCDFKAVAVFSLHCSSIAAASRLMASIILGTSASKNLEPILV